MKPILKEKPEPFKTWDEVRYFRVVRGLIEWTVIIAMCWLAALVIDRVATFLGL